MSNINLAQAEPDYSWTAGTLILLALLVTAACVLRAAVSPSRASVPILSAGCAVAFGVLAFDLQYASTGLIVAVLAAVGLLIPLAALLFDATSDDVRQFRHHGRGFSATIDIINAVVLAYVAFVLLPWDWGIVQRGLALLGLGLGVVIGAARWLIDQRLESIGPAVVLASATAVTPSAIQWAVRAGGHLWLGWIVMILCGLAVVTLALASAHRFADRGAAP